MVLSSCHSTSHAKIISRHSIYVVGMNKEIGENAAVDFSVSFYKALVKRRNFELAFDRGYIAVAAHAMDAFVPELWLDGIKIRPIKSGVLEDLIK